MAASERVKGTPWKKAPSRALQGRGVPAITTSTGASRANRFIRWAPEKAASPSRERNGSRSARRNLQGWPLQAEGASRAASQHRSSTSRGTGRES